MKFIRNLITNILSNIFTYFYLHPSKLIEQVILIPVILVSICFNHNIFCIRFVEWIMIYGLSLFAFRIMVNTFFWFTYDTNEIFITPITICIISLLLLTSIRFINPNYNIGYKNANDEEIGKNCNEAIWTLTIWWNINNSGGMGDSKYFLIRGNTDCAKKQKNKIIKSFFDENPRYSYRKELFTLTNLPKEYCIKNNYNNMYWQKTDPFRLEIGEALCH